MTQDKPPSWKDHSLYLLLCVAALGFGCYIRFNGIALWSWTPGELPMILAARHLLHAASPAMDCGVNVSSVLMPALYAAGMGIWPGAEEGFLRGMHIVFSLSALPVLYGLARHAMGAAAGLVLLTMMMLSGWEVETARHLSLEGPFQALLIWYLWFFYRYTVVMRQHAFVGMLLTSGLAFLIDSHGLFLSVLNFLPFLIHGEVRRKLFPILALGLLAVAVASRFYLQGAAAVIGAVTLPPSLLNGLADAGLWQGLAGVLLLLSVGFVCYRVAQDKSFLPVSRLVLLLSFLSALVHMFTVAWVILVLALSLDLIRLSSFRQPAMQWWLAAMVSCAIYWPVFAMTQTHWYARFDGPDFDPVRQMLLLFFQYPDFYGAFAATWLDAMPKFTAVLLAIIAAGWCFVMLRPNAPAYGFRMLFTVALLLAVAVSVMAQTEPGHSGFILYPLVLLLAMYAALLLLPGHSNGGQWLALPLFLLLFIAAEDFQWNYLKEVADNQKIESSRAPNTDGKQAFERVDFKTPAQHINGSAIAEDTIISFSATVGYYLDRWDYFVIDPRTPGSCRVSAPIKTIDGFDQLDETLQQPGTFWVVAHSPNIAGYTEPERLVHKQYQDKIVYTGVDGMMLVYRIVH